MKLKAWFKETWKALPGLMKQTMPVVRKIMGVLAPCGLALLVMEVLKTSTAAVGGGMLISLLNGLVVTPVAVGMITYAAGASWEGRSAGLKDAVQLARIRIREIAVTGLAAGLIIWLTGWIATMAYSLVGAVSALLGWIPVIGAVVTAAAAVVVRLISLTMEYAAHIALVIGMMALTVDGISGRPQIDRATGILRAGGKRMLGELALVFGLWIAAHGLDWLIGLIAPVGAYAGDILIAGATALSMAAVSVIYLTERDRMDGMRYHG